MRKTAILSTLFLASAIAWGQATPTQTTPPQSQAPTTGSQPANGTPNQAPANPQAAPTAGGHRVLQAKSQDELKAYQEAATKTDPAQAEAAANDFAAKFPDSDLRSALYQRTMNMYAQAGNTDKVVDVGRKAIAADPINPVPLMEVASTLAENTRDSDLDREQRLAEAAKDAHGAIDNIDTGLLLPANPDPEKVAAAKRTILTNSYTALGVVDMNRNDYAAAATSFQKAIDESKDTPEAVLYLRLSVAQDRQKEYQQALASANKAVQYAKPGTPAETLAKQQQDRMQKLLNAETPGAVGAQPGIQQPGMPQPNPTTPGVPSSTSPIPGPGTTPH